MDAVGHEPRAMTTLTCTSRTHAPVDVAWSVFADPAHWPGWAPHIRRVDGRTTLGVVEHDEHLTVHSLVPGLTVDAEVTEVAPPTRWTFVVRPVPGVEVAAAHEIVDEGGARRLVSELRPAGRLAVPAALALRLYRPIAQRAMDLLAERCDEHAERRPTDR